MDLKPQGTPPRPRDRQTNAGNLTHARSLPLRELQRMRILLVDNEQAQFTRIRKVLDVIGLSDAMDRCTADALQMRLEQARQLGIWRIDALLVDSTSIDSPRLARILKVTGQWSDLPVLLLGDEEQIGNNCLPAHPIFFDVVIRPIRDRDLMHRLLAALRLKRERDIQARKMEQVQSGLSRNKTSEAHLEYLVAHDELTGLYNRRHLEQELEKCVARTGTEGRTSALIYFDLDQYKLVKSLEGHAVGDRLLRLIAQRLYRHVASSNTLTRVSSDEFGLLAENVDQDQAVRIAESIRASLNSFHLKIGERRYDISTSIGIAMISPKESITAEDILARADQACFIAKNRGKNMVHMHNRQEPEFQTIQRNLHWVPRIRDALRNDSFTLLFQPLRNIASNNVKSYEVLVRLQGDDGELELPSDFIAVAERMGLIHDIDRWVISRTIDVLQNLPDEYGHLGLNINLSGCAFENASLLPDIRSLLKATGVDGRRITFEITETATIANFERTRALIEDIRKLGCRFALDDFGSGFNSYNYLRHLPVDYLKIDGSFVQFLVGDPIDQALVRSMVEVAHALDKRIVAEYVEDEETLAVLQTLGVDYAQGYFIGKPQRRLIQEPSVALSH